MKRKKQTNKKQTECHLLLILLAFYGFRTITREKRANSMYLIADLNYKQIR